MLLLLCICRLTLSRATARGGSSNCSSTGVIVVTGGFAPSPVAHAAVLLHLQAHIEQSNRAWWPIQLLNRWLSIRLELTGAVIVFICAVAVSVLVPRNAGLAGLALTSALNLTGTLAWMVRQTTELEVNMNSGGLGCLLLWVLWSVV
jgi:hypothetical protein